MWILALLACQTPDPAPPGVDPAIPAHQGEARAGWVAPGAGEAALFGGVTAEGRAGDVKLYNHLVQVVIQGPYEGSGYVDAGGGIIDVDLVRPDGALGRDLVEDIFLAFGFARLFDASTVEIVADGSDGGPAVVQSRGTDVPWLFIQGLFEHPAPNLDDLFLDIVTTYELAPDAPMLTITTSLTNAGTEHAVFTPQLGSLASGEDLLAWAPGAGFQGPAAGPLQAAIFTGRNGEATFSTWSDGGLTLSGFSAFAGELGIFLADAPEIDLGPGESATLVRRLVIAPDPAKAEALRRAASGETLATVSGRVHHGSEGVPGARVHLVDSVGEVAGFAITGVDGAWSADLPIGDWTAWVMAQSEDERVALPAGAGRYGPFAAERVNQAQLDVLAGTAVAAPLPFAAGRATPPPTPFSLTATGATLDLEIPAPGRMRVELVDGAGDPVPGVIELRWAAGAPPPGPVPEALRSALGVATSGRAAWAWTSTGVLEIDTEPGVYDIAAGHSWRFGRASQAGVTVAEGQSASVRLTLDEVVARDGWLAVDPHLHGAPSFDGALPMEDRLVTCAATGVDLPVTTDHDAIADYRRLATALGLDSRMRVLPGTEVTTLMRGHFNLYPLDPSPLASANGGAERWWHAPADTQELFDRMRRIVGQDGIIQVNHPRTPGMFAFAGLEGATPSKPELWSWDFQAFELLNGGVSDLDQLRADWFAMLDAGNIRVPTGASDSHYRYIPCGLGRTDVFLDTTDVSAVTPESVRDAMKAGHVVVASGTILRATATGGGAAAMPGDTVSGSAITVHATVAAPAWMEPGTLRVYVGGAVVVEEAVPTGDGLRLDQTWTLDVPSDSWVVVEVVGAVPQGDAWRNALPYAATNAFFVDVAGDGWTAPGLR